MIHLVANERTEKGIEKHSNKKGAMHLNNSLKLQWYVRLGSNQWLSAPEIYLMI